jgi:hypothetical protein
VLFVKIIWTYVDVDLGHIPPMASNPVVANNIDRTNNVADQ